MKGVMAPREYVLLGRIVELMAVAVGVAALIDLIR